MSHTVLNSECLAHHAVHPANDGGVRKPQGEQIDAQHFAAELIGRFEKERRALPAIALNTDTSALTALSNDYGYESVFARQVEGLGTNGDALVAISTSGNSKNVIRAVDTARKNSIITIGLLGRDGGKIMSSVDFSVIVPHDNTARIQESHIFIIHFWCAMIENTFCKLSDKL